MSARFLFVGEKRSPRAIKLGVTWIHGRLSGKTLFDALRAAGLEPRDHAYANLLREGPGRVVDRAALRRIRQLAAAGVVVVAMGCKVQAELDRRGVLCLHLVHPAARGVIRTRAVYRAHVAAVLGPHLAPPGADRVAG